MPPKGAMSGGSPPKMKKARSAGAVLAPAPPGSFRPMALTNRMENAQIELQKTVLQKSLEVANRAKARPQPNWSQPDPDDIWFTQNGEYSTLAETSLQQLDPRSQQNAWHDDACLAYSRINPMTNKNTRSYFDRLLPTLELRDQTLAYPSIHDVSPQYKPGMGPVEAAQEYRISKYLERVNECEKRRALPVTWENGLVASTPKELHERAGCNDKRLTRTDPDRRLQNAAEAQAAAAIPGSGGYKHPKSWNESHHIMNSRTNAGSSSWTRDYFDRPVAVKGHNDLNLIPKKLKTVWDLRDESEIAHREWAGGGAECPVAIEMQRKHEAKIKEIWKKSEPKWPEKFHGGEWIP